MSPGSTGHFCKQKTNKLSLLQTKKGTYTFSHVDLAQNDAAVFEHALAKKAFDAGRRVNLKALFKQRSFHDDSWDSVNLHAAPIDSKNKRQKKKAYVITVQMRDKYFVDAPRFQFASVELTRGSFSTVKQPHSGICVFEMRKAQKAPNEMRLGL